MNVNRKCQSNRFIRCIYSFVFINDETLKKLFRVHYDNIATPDFFMGIKQSFACINIYQVAEEVLKTKAAGRGFQHLTRDVENVNTLNNYVQSLLLHKN